MRYFRDISNDDKYVFQPLCTRIKNSNHPVYNDGTLFQIDDLGLVVIQQEYMVDSKLTFWTAIPDKLANELYIHDNFQDYFYKHAGKQDKDGLWPTVTLRQIMWGLRLKPIKKQRWETVFDRKQI